MNALEEYFISHVKSGHALQNATHMRPVQISVKQTCAQDHQQAYRIVKTMAATACNIQLIAETITASHTGMAYHVEHNAQGMTPHHGLSLLIRIESACVEHMPVTRGEAKPLYKIFRPPLEKCVEHS